MTPGLESCHALVLNADFRPLSYFPLSIWSWQDAVKAVFLDRVSVISEYERKIHSPSCEMKLPSVIALKEYVPAARRPAFTRFNVFLRDHFNCQYCGGDFATNELTFDHVVPKSRGGRTVWTNVVTACSPCNTRKSNHLPEEIGMHPLVRPVEPHFVHLSWAVRKLTPTQARYIRLFYGEGVLHQLEKTL